MRAASAEWPRRLIRRELSGRQLQRSPAGHVVRRLGRPVRSIVPSRFRLPRRHSIRGCPRDLSDSSRGAQGLGSAFCVVAMKGRSALCDASVDVSPDGAPSRPRHAGLWPALREGPGGDHPPVRRAHRLGQPGSARPTYRGGRRPGRGCAGRRLSQRVTHMFNGRPFAHVRQTRGFRGCLPGCLNDLTARRCFM